MAREAKTVKVVFEQKGGIEGELRLRTLSHVAGEKRTLTEHRENGCRFRVDVAKCYFSPRLATERLRVAEESDKNEKVLNMFAGVGPLSVEVAKVAGAKVTSWEVSGYSCGLHRENNKLNKVVDLVQVVEGDAASLAKSTRKRYDRVLMPHPSRADRFLPAAAKLARSGGVVHYYRHVLGGDEAEAKRNISAEVEAMVPGSEYTVRRVREVGPRWMEMEAEVRVP